MLARLRLKCQDITKLQNRKEVINGGNGYTVMASTTIRLFVTIRRHTMREMGGLGATEIASSLRSLDATCAPRNDEQVVAIFITSAPHPLTIRWLTLKPWRTDSRTRRAPISFSTRTIRSTGTRGAK